MKSYYPLGFKRERNIWQDARGGDQLWIGEERGHAAWKIELFHVVPNCLVFAWFTCRIIGRASFASAGIVISGPSSLGEDATTPIALRPQSRMCVYRSNAFFWWA